MPAVSGIKETCLTVADVDRSEAFYRKLFGFSVLEGESRFRALNVADTHVLLLFAEGQSTEPMPLPGGIIPPHDARGQSHVAFAISTDQVEAWKSALLNIRYRSRALSRGHAVVRASTSAIRTVIFSN
jgi:catechol 2,3-dioxygenase-like lactoylglutathione lyase family enzyme